MSVTRFRFRGSGIHAVIATSILITLSVAAPAESENFPFRQSADSRTSSHWSGAREYAASAGSRDLLASKDDGSSRRLSVVFTSGWGFGTSISSTGQGTRQSWLLSARLGYKLLWLDISHGRTWVPYRASGMQYGSVQMDWTVFTPGIGSEHAPEPLGRISYFVGVLGVGIGANSFSDEDEGDRLRAFESEYDTDIQVMADDGTALIWFPVRLGYRVSDHISLGVSSSILRVKAEIMRFAREISIQEELPMTRLPGEEDQTLGSWQIHATLSYRP